MSDTSAITISKCVDPIKTIKRILLRYFYIDRPVFFGLADKVWLIMAGPVTMILIATCFTPELQGYYYTFANLLALQVFVEMGLGTVIIQFASHEWSKLSLNKEGKIVGDDIALSRLTSLTQIATKWYLVGGAVLSIGLAIGGYIFFSTSSNVTNVNWSGPWILLSLMTGINIILLPLWSILEGCNQVNKLYAYRFVQNIFKNVFLWIAIFGGAKLWSASVSVLVIIVCASIFILSHYKKFFIQLLRSKPSSSVIKWKEELLPMQWRIALSWMSGYFVFSLFTPVLFKYQGPVVAGQMGMTWSMVGLVGALSSAWVSPKVPSFGMLIAKQSYEKLDKEFWRLIKIVFIVSVLVSLCIFIGVVLLNFLKLKISTRFLPLFPIFLFLVAQIMLALSCPVAAYLRAHKKEPLMYLSVAAAVMTAVSTLVLGKKYSSTGVAFGYLLTNAIIIPMVFIVWEKCKMTWHACS